MKNTDIFQKRRSINFFDPQRKISSELLAEIVDMATLAPSAFNLQPWRIIAVESPEAKEKLLPLAFGQPKIMEASTILILVGDYNGWATSNPVWPAMEPVMGAEGIERAQGMAQNLYGSSPEASMKFAESNTGLLAMAIMYAAQTFGVESHPMSGINFAGIEEAFSLKEGEHVVMLLALGYLAPGKELYPRAPRRTSQEIIAKL